MSSSGRYDPGRRREGGVLLDSPRDPDDSAAVAQMPADLSLHAARDVGRQADCALGVAAVDGPDQADRADLHEVLEPLASSREARGGTAYERQMVFDHAAPHGIVSIFESLRGRRIAFRTLHLVVQHKHLGAINQSAVFLLRVSVYYQSGM